MGDLLVFAFQGKAFKALQAVPGTASIAILIAIPTQGQMSYVLYKSQLRKSSMRHALQDRQPDSAPPVLYRKSADCVSRFNHSQRPEGFDYCPLNSYNRGCPAMFFPAGSNRQRRRE
ncbi:MULTISPECIES: hypothetical protein [Paraburkholderia]|uniref:hypothetical protein n=1 Tax=Paraburkholderia TaxID=1822464 RepID=UPI000375B615|nr:MULTISPECIES: hypothetical protein [Paraburkholderia]MDH6146656.1 hypothetical protein [Paraburkholderia sp. WSM4179]